MLVKLINSLLTSIVLFASTLGFFLNSNSKNVDNSDTLKTTYTVGLFEREGFFSDEVNTFGVTEYYGYAADLLYSIEETSGLTFKPVTGSHSELLEKLRTGEIDILPGLLNIEDRNDEFDFSQVIGTLFPVLLTSPERNDLFADDFENFDGLKIGFIDGAKSNDLFYDLAKEYNFSFSAYEYESIADGKTALFDNDIDCLFTTTLIRLDGFKVLSILDGLNYYFGFTKGSNALKEAFDNSIKTILKTAPDYFSELYNKYYSTINFETIFAFTRSEEEYIQSQKNSVIKYYYRSNFAPYEYEDESGEMRGLSRDILDKTAAYSGLEFEFIPVDNTSQLGPDDSYEYDCFGNYCNSLTTIGNSKFKSSPTVFSDPLVELFAENNSKNDKVAILSFLKNDSFNYIRQNYDVVEYDTVLDCYKAVKNKEVGSLIVTNLIANYWSNNIIYKNFNRIEIDASLVTGYNVGISNSASPYLYSILTKVGKRFSSATINNFVESYNTPDFIYTLVEKIFYDTTFQFQTIITLITIEVIFGVIIAYSIHKHNFITNSFVEGTKVYNRTYFFSETSKMLNKSKKNFVFALLQIDRYQVLHATFGEEEIKKYMFSIMDYVQEHYIHRSNLRFGLTDNDTFGFCFEYTPDNMDYFALANKEISKIISNNLGFFHVGFYIIKDNTQKTSFYYDYAKLALEKAQINNTQNVNFAFYDESFIQQIQISNYYVKELPRALKEHEFQIYLQPKVRIKDGKIIGAEALVRWNHPVEGLISPGKFVPIFEKNGMIVNIDKLIWEITCDFINKNHNKFKWKVPISVNLSRSDVYSFRIFTYILDLVKKYNISPDELSFEITESLYSENPQLINNLINKLHSANFKVSMDDFGSAYSSLNILKDLPVDGLKIDLAFLRGTEWNLFDKNTKIKRAEYIISAVVKMAHSLDMACICEGVETNEQLELIKRANCENAQGYLYSRPVPVNVFLSMLEKGYLYGKE